MTVTTCVHDHPETANRLFCGLCGKVKDRSALRSVRLMGAVGVRHSSSLAIGEFWHTGDPETPGL